jgi:hypothetical protein
MQGVPREPGFYWVRLKNEKDWRVGEDVSGVWSVPFRSGFFEDDELAEIDPERLVRGVTRLYPRV